MEGGREGGGEAYKGAGKEQRGERGGDSRSSQRASVEGARNKDRCRNRVETTLPVISLFSSQVSHGRPVQKSGYRVSFNSVKKPDETLCCIPLRAREGGSQPRKKKVGGKRMRSYLGSLHREQVFEEGQAVVEAGVQLGMRPQDPHHHRVLIRQRHNCVRTLDGACHQEIDYAV